MNMRKVFTDKVEEVNASRFIAAAWYFVVTAARASQGYPRRETHAEEAKEVGKQLVAILKGDTP